MAPLFADETYYYIWSLFPKLSYYDHPGMVGWLIFLGRSLFSFHNPLSVRLFFVVLGTASLFIWLLILEKKKIPQDVWIYFFALYNLNPLLGIGSIVATPDVPLVFFWSLAYLCFLNVFDSKKLIWYFLLGCSLGLGFCSKYHIVLFILCGLLATFINLNYRSLRVKGIFLSLAGGLLFSLPVLIWNYQNDWVSFAYQLKHGFGRTYYNFEWSTSYLMGQFLIVSPFLFIQLFSFKKRTPDQTFAVSQLLFFFTSTFKSVVEANWTIAAQPHAIVHFMETLSIKKIKWTFAYWTVTYAALLLILFTPMGHSIHQPQLNTNDIAVLVPLAEQYQPLYGPNYQISSLLSWQAGKLVPKLVGFSRKDFFNDIDDSIPKFNSTFYVLKETAVGWPDYLVTSQIKKIKSIESLELELYQVTYE